MQGATMGTHHHPLPARNTSLPHPATAVNTRGPKSRAGVFIGGPVGQWLRAGLGLVRATADIEPLATSVPDNGGVYLVPAFAGLGAPHWDQYARGSISGITRGTTSAHLARAGLESIA